MGYRMDIWSWKEKERVECLGERYLRWILRADSKTPEFSKETVIESETKKKVG